MCLQDRPRNFSTSPEHNSSLHINLLKLIREHHKNVKLMPPLVLISGSWHQLEIAGIRGPSRRMPHCAVIIFSINELSKRSISNHPYILGFQFSQYTIIFFYPHTIPSHLWKNLRAQKNPPPPTCGILGIDLLHEDWPKITPDKSCCLHSRQES